MSQPDSNDSPRRPLRLYFCVGDISADLHAANLIREIRKLRPDAVIEGMGGPRMAEAGCTIHYPLTTMNVMWFSNVVGHLHRVWQTQRAALKHLDANRPDAVVMMDFPGYNLMLARWLRKRRIPVIYYISPQIWAWMPSRISKIHSRVTKVLCIFPFEEEIYQRAGIPVEFVGHPLYDHLDGVKTDEGFCAELRKDAGELLIGLLPGSRAQEVRSLLPVMVRAGERVKQEHPNASFVVACPNEAMETLACRILARYNFPARVVRGRTFEVMKESNLVMVASGTATLEVAHFGTPMIILYRVTIPARILGLIMMKTKFIGIVNILLGREAVPERLLWRDDPAGVSGLALDILKNPERRAEIQSALREVRQMLDHPGASHQAADAVVRFASEYRGRVPDGGSQWPKRL